MLLTLWSATCRDETKPYQRFSWRFKTFFVQHVTGCLDEKKKTISWCFAAAVWKSICQSDDRGRRTFREDFFDHVWHRVSSSFFMIYISLFVLCISTCQTYLVPQEQRSTFWTASRFLSEYWNDALTYDICTVRLFGMISVYSFSRKLYIIQRLRSSKSPVLWQRADTSSLCNSRYTNYAWRALHPFIVILTSLHVLFPMDSTFEFVLKTCELIIFPR